MTPHTSLNTHLTRLSALLALCLALTLTLESRSAHADLVGAWLKPKATMINGTGEVFKRFESSPAFGLEAGVELLNISLWVDYNAMGAEQYLASANLGMDFDFDLGESFVFTIGGYGGGLIFGFPPSSSAESTSALDANKAELEMIAGSQYGAFEAKYNELASAEETASNMSFGLNARARASLEYKLAPFVRLGVEGLMGWHYVISGEEAASDLKGRAVDAFIDEQKQKLPSDQAAMVEGQRTALKDALGAEEVNLDELKGTHYTLSAFLNFKF